MKKQAVNAKVRGAWNPWPYAIVAWFVLFATGLAAWIVVAVRNDMDLVREDYYEHEVLYQRHLDRAARASAAGFLECDYDASAQSILIRLPTAHAREHASGQIHLYRPSDAKLDREIELALNAEGMQRVDTRTLRPGLWKVRVQWRVNGEEFYFDRSVVIAAGTS